MKPYSCLSRVKYAGSAVEFATSPKCLRSINAVVITSLTLLGASAATDFCQQTSHDALEACQDTAEGDQSIAFGKCDNVSDPTGRWDLPKQGGADFKAATQTCHDQFDARQAACQKLGPAPFDPVIDSA